MERLVDSITGITADDSNSEETTVSESEPAPDAMRADGNGVARAVKLKRITEVRRDAMRLQRLEKNLVMQGASADFDASGEIVAELKRRLRGGLDALATMLAEREQEKLKAMATSINVYLEIHTRVLEAARQEGNLPGSQWASGVGEPMADKVETIAQSMVEQSERALDEYEVESSALHVAFRNGLLLLSVLAIAISVFVSLWIGGGVARNVRQLSAYAHQVHRAKDLTQPIPSVGNDETGELAEAFEGMRVALLSQNSRLARLNDTLEHKNDEMEQFVYSVSHDLKSPLVSCKGLVGLINEDIADGEFVEARNSAARLSDVTDQMNRSIDELLMFSRLGHSPLEQIVVDMESLFHELAQEWSEREDCPSPRIEVQPEIHAIYGDPIALRRVFDNLIGNAVKYASGSSGAEIRLGSEKHGRKIRYFVEDRGPGI